MPFCRDCGFQVNDGANFCLKCGSPVFAVNALQVSHNLTVVPVQNITSTNVLLPYKGVARTFTFKGETITISPGMDAFNYYRKLFRSHANQAAGYLKAEYMAHIVNLDVFLIDFATIYLNFRKSLLKFAFDLLIQSKIYDISFEKLEEQHTADFCLCGNDLQTVIDSFNLTLQANQERKVRTYNMMPGLIYSGVSGMVTAAVINVTMTNMMEASIRNANVTPRQRFEIFQRINTDILMKDAYLDYWRVFLTLTFSMKIRGLDVWYPNEEDTQRASGLFTNLCSGRLPKDETAKIIACIIQTCPFSDDYFSYINSKYAFTSEIAAINEYFGFDGITV